MGARRVGFGEDDGRAQRRSGPSRRAESDDAAPAAADAGGEEMSRFGKAILALFLIVWLIGWSIGLVEMAGVVPSAYARGDWFGVGFGAVWLTFGAIGWLFAAVLLLAILFGKKRDPSKPSRFQLRKAAWTAARRDRSRD